MTWPAQSQRASCQSAPKLCCHGPWARAQRTLQNEKCFWTGKCLRPICLFEVRGEAWNEGQLLKRNEAQLLMR